MIVKNIIKMFNKYGLRSISILKNIVIRKISLVKFKKKLDKKYYSSYNKLQNPTYLKSVLQKLPQLPHKNNIKIIKEKKIFSKQVKIIIAESDRFLNNEFNILGSNWIKWENNGVINWHSDEKTHFSWSDDIYYTNFKKIISSLTKFNKTGADIKVPWELSRFHFLFSLFFSYIYTSDNKYILKIKNTISSWIDKNPPFYGVNWVSPMEVAIRITNWCLIIYNLKNEILQDPEFFKKYIKSLWLHVQFIKYNLENIKPYNNNHYLANIAGIYIASALFPIFDESQELLDWSSTELKKEIKKQVYQDGGDYESATPYQRLVIELFFLPLYIEKNFHYNYLDKKYEKNLHKMFVFLMNILKPNGEIIQFGDNDDGRLFKLYNRPPLLHAYLLSLGYCIFTDNNLCIKEFPFDILSFIFESKNSSSSYLQKGYSIFTLPSTDFRQSGIYILRNLNFYTAVSCMPFGRKGYGVHTHNDKLSFSLTYKKQNIIVDPGSYVYTASPTLRNKFRSTYYHNTVQENSFEQNSFGDNIFEMSNDTTIKIKNFNQNQLECQHNGFLKNGGNIHYRKIDLYKTGLKIFDKLFSSFDTTVFLHFYPGIKIKKQSKFYYIIKDNDILLKLYISKPHIVRVESYMYSPAYGNFLKAQKMKIIFNNNISITFSEI